MVDKVTKRLKLDLSKVPKEKKQDAKEAVGNYILNKMGEYLEQSKSPVTGGKFKDLDKDYKKIKKKMGGSSSPDLFLTGKMQGHLSYETYRDGVEVGVFDNTEAQKADNHNKNSAKSKKTAVPQRQFVPYQKKKGTRGSFHIDIKNGINEIIDGFIDGN